MITIKNFKIKVNLVATPSSPWLQKVETENIKRVEKTKRLDVDNLSKEALVGNNHPFGLFDRLHRRVPQQTE